MPGIYSKEVVDEKLRLKVSIIEGKDLSSNDFTDLEKEKLDSLYSQSDLNSILESKVSKLEGKVLSSNDYTDLDKLKLEELSNYQLPVATTRTLGGIIVGSNLSISESGVLAATGVSGATSILVLLDPPSDTNALWIDTGNSILHQYSEELSSVLRAIALLLQQVNKLLPIVNQGVIAGSPSNSVREALMGEAEPIAPDVIDEEEEVLYAVPPKYALDTEPTVKHISIKMGTYAEIQSNKLNFINGELVWCTDRNKMYIYIDGILKVVAGSGGDDPIDPDDPEDEPMSELDLQKLASIIVDGSELETDYLRLHNIERIDFKSISSGINYSAKVNDEGVLVVYDAKEDIPQFADALGNPNDSGDWGFTSATAGLVLNSMYAGGDADEHSYLGCSHNYVELANVLTNKGYPEDINLNGFALVYTKLLTSGGIPSPCYILPLLGKIKAGETYLIRGALCSVMDANTTKIKVNSFDLLWRDSNGDLVKFDRDLGSFHLCHYKYTAGNYYIIRAGGAVTDTMQLLLFNTYTDLDGKLSSWSTDSFAYSRNSDSVKLVGLGNYQIVDSDADVIFRRWYPQDPVSQSNETVDGRTPDDNWTVCYLDGRNVKDVQDLLPKASYEHKTMKLGRTEFSEIEPSTLTITLGINGDAGLLGGATRCFCWNSVGYYDEALKYKKTTDSTWTTLESMKTFNDVATLLDITSVPNDELEFWSYYYCRKRWETPYGLAITTHKVVVKGLQAGTYEYLVVRLGDSNYHSDVRTTTIYDRSNGNFSFILTTDLLGATWEEYEVWDLSARRIADVYLNGNATNDEEEVLGGTIPTIDFTINTGDICYNGSRPNEWIDYLNGYKHINVWPEMLTIGNNDLAPVNMYDIGNGGETPWKINVEVADYYYCYEWDVNNPPILKGFKGGQIKKFRVPSLYSFNYGDKHFISLLSEIRTGSTKDEGGKTGNNTVTNIFGIDDLDCTLTGAGAINGAWSYNSTTGVVDSNSGNTVFPYSNASLCRYVYYLIHLWLLRDWNGKNGEDCIVFTHEMPFNIIAGSSYTRFEGKSADPNATSDKISSGRESAKAYLNRNYGYLFPRIFKDKGIRIVTGGHKHTVGITYPMYDAPTDSSFETNFSDLSGLTTKELKLVDTFCPIMQLLPSLVSSFPLTYVKEIYNRTSQTVTFLDSNTLISAGLHVIVKALQDGKVPSGARCRVEIVDSLTAPQYIMCLATGFKNRSNSDLAAVGIPWEIFCVPDEAGNKVVAGQCYPFFTLYDLTSSSCNVGMYRIINMYDPTIKKGYWDLSKIYNNSYNPEGGAAVYNKETLYSKLSIDYGDGERQGAVTKLTIQL